MRIAAFFALAHMVGFACAAPTPKLDSAPPIICAVSGGSGWKPSLDAIRDLEMRLPGYFVSIKDAKNRLPAVGIVFSRQYTGLLINGKKIIRGRYYPVGEPGVSGATGECWETLDGGNRYWELRYDIQTGVFTHLFVNGEA